MKSYVTSSSLLLLLFALNLSAQELHWKDMLHPNFQMNARAYQRDHVYFFHALFSKNKPIEIAEIDSLHAFSDFAQPLDIYNYWENREEERYDVLFTKTAYLLEKPVDYFSSYRLSDVEFIKSTMPSATIAKQDSIYHIAMGFGSPDIQYTLQFYSDESFQKTYPTLLTYFSSLDGVIGRPELVVVQHNFNYGRILFQKTTKMSVSISRYFALEENRTLVLNYTLNYIYNMPPTIIGGSDYLLSKIKEGIGALISETQMVCQRNNQL